MQGQHGKSLCCPAFSLSFNGLLVLVLLQFPDEVPDNLDFSAAGGRWTCPAHGR